MAFLRSGKFFRFLSVGKNLVNFREYEAAHQLPPLCVCSSNNFTSIAASATNQSLENSLKRLDQDVRRSGRISRRDLEEILEEIRTNKSATSSQSLLVIRCCGSLVPEEMPEIRTKMVQEIWKTLAKLNVPMDISHYNALLRVYLENEYTFSPTEFLADLQSKGVEPNRVTFQRLISRYCQQGDIDGATQILEFMREKQLPVNENVFNALIMGHSNADDLESAVGILGVMTQAGLEPSADTYTTLLCGFARKGDIESINKFISQCEEKDVFLLDKDYLEVVYALAVNGHNDKIDEVLLKLKKAFGYNQDAVNVILRLINKGQEATAMKILNTMPRSTRQSGESLDAGNFLIKQLIKANRPVEQIITICNELEETGLNSKPIMIAIEAALTTRNATLSKALLGEMLKKGMEVRQHYFWPILSTARSEQEVSDICSMMRNDFKLPMSNQTIRDYVIPKILVEKNYNMVIEKLRAMGITSATASATTAYVALNKLDIEKAAQIMQSVEAYYSPGLYKRPLLLALSQTKDYDSHAKIIRQINDNMSRARAMNQATRQEEVEDEQELEVDAELAVAPGRSIKSLQAEVVGDLVIDVLVLFKTNRVEAVTNVLSRLVDQGISISSFKAEKIQERLGESLTAEISTMLGKLASGELEPAPFQRQRMQRAAGGVAPSMDTEKLERLITRLEEKGENTKGLKRSLLVAAIKEKNVEKTEQIIERLKDEGYTLTSGVYAQLIELYASADMLEQALIAHKKIRDSDPEFVLDESKTIKVVHAYLNADRLDDAIKFLEDNKLKEIPDEKAFMYQTTVWRLLNSLAEKAKTVEVNKLFESLVANKFIVPNNVLLGPLIKVYLVQDQLKEAVDKFEEICHKYRATPWKNEIACRLIQSEDAQSLQKVTDLSTEIHGEVNSLYDLVFSFIECGRVRQARKILETPGLRTRPGRINFACERYLNEGMPTALEGLIEATKDLSHIDRSEIYYTLLQTYIKEVAPEKALGLWTAMQEEDITPSEVFLSKLAGFLTAQGHEVPFHVPVGHEAPVVEKKRERTSKQQTTPKEPARRRDVELSATHNAFKEAIIAGNPDNIMSAMQNLSPTDKLSLGDRSQVIEALVKSERHQEATKMVFDMLANQAHPIPRIFRYYLNKIAGTGDTETIEKVGKQLSPEAKKSISFDNRLCHAYVRAGKSEEFLQALENAIDGAQTEEEISKVVEVFPRGGAVGILEHAPELAERFEKIAIKFVEKKALGPINVLWMHYLVNHDPKADEIFHKYLVDSPRLMFQRVIQMGRENQDEKLVQKLIDLLHGTKVSEGAIGNAYSCLMDIYATKDNADGCLKTVEACVRDVCFENVNRTALVRAKACVEKSGLKFPHALPEKKVANNQDTSSSSSSSSSDDEVTQKKVKS